jgi:hypothetical protein
MGKPVWRQVFDRVERTVGEPLEQVVASRRYIDIVVLGMKGPLAVNRVLRGIVDRQIGAVLHLVNMPTRDDMVRLSRQLAVLTAELRSLSLPADQISGYVVQLQKSAAENGGPSLAALDGRRGELDPSKEGVGGT